VQRRAKTLEIRKGDFDELLDPSEYFSDQVRMWPVSSYYVYEGCVVPKGENKPNLEFPLSDPNLFLSFARLGARGEPSQKSILAWVHKYGLLRGKDRQLELDEPEEWDLVIGEARARVEEVPMPVKEFKTEVRCANQLLKLHADIRARNLESLASLYVTAPAVPDWSDKTIIDRYLETRWYRPLGGRSVRIAVEKGTFAFKSLEVYHEAARRLLERAVTYMLCNVDLSLTDNVWPPSPTDNMWPPSPDDSPLILKRSWVCPDLLSAMYLQFYLLMVAYKPLKRCESPVCRQPFLATRKDKRFCNDTCRSNARNYR
jgi:hypothetical protein